MSVKKNFGALLVGIIFLVVGGSYVVARILGYDPPFFFDGWWTLLLMVPAVINMVEAGVNLGNTMVLAAGALLLCWEQNWIRNMNFTMVLSVLLVILGGYLIIRAFTGKKLRSKDAISNGQWRVDGRDMPSYTSIFSSINVKSGARNLLSATCSAVFGRLRVDLSDVAVTHDMTIFCNAVLGQVTIFAPKNVKIVCKNVPLIGGVRLWADSLPADAAAPTVTFECTTIIGDVDIQ